MSFLLPRTPSGLLNTTDLLNMWQSSNNKTSSEALGKYSMAGGLLAESTRTLINDNAPMVALGNWLDVCYGGGRPVLTERHVHLDCGVSLRR